MNQRCPGETLCALIQSEDHGFTVVTLTAPLYCGRNVGCIKFDYIINVDIN